VGIIMKQRRPNPVVIIPNNIHKTNTRKRAMISLPSMRNILSSGMVRIWADASTGLTLPSSMKLPFLYRVGREFPRQGAHQLRKSHHRMLQMLQTTILNTSRKTHMHQPLSEIHQKIFQSEEPVLSGGNTKTRL
jgi:hypothetical protein